MQGKLDYQDRMNSIQQYVSTVMTCDCSESLLLASVERVLTAVVQKVNRTLTKQKKFLYEECKHVLNQLYSRVELYCQGNLHCCCFSPYIPQRHFIQCNNCSLWFHTSCVNVDSRRISNIVTFVCSWCQQNDENDDKDSNSPSSESVHSSSNNHKAQRIRGEDVSSIFDLSVRYFMIILNRCQLVVLLLKVLNLNVFVLFVKDRLTVLVIYLDIFMRNIQ